MTKTLSLAASMLLLAISGPALAGTVAPHAADRQTPRAYGAFNQITTMPTTAPDAHRYEGGPKSND